MRKQCASRRLSASLALIVSLPSRLEADRDAALRKASDRERLLTELQRTKTLKEKLEELCRSLQKQNRDVAEAEQAKRQELNDKFKSSIDDISSKLQTQSEMHKDNELLTQRLALVTKQSELRDQQQAAELKAKALEASSVAACFARHCVTWALMVRWPPWTWMCYSAL